MEFFNGSQDVEQADAEVRSRTFEEIVADCPEPLRSKLIADHEEHRRNADSVVAALRHDAAKWSRIKWGYSKATNANR